MCKTARIRLLFPLFCLSLFNISSAFSASARESSTAVCKKPVARRFRGVHGIDGIFIFCESFDEARLLCQSKKKVSYTRYNEPKQFIQMYSDGAVKKRFIVGYEDRNVSPNKRLLICLDEEDFDGYVLFFKDRKHISSEAVFRAENGWLYIVRYSPKKKKVFKEKKLLFKSSKNDLPELFPGGEEVLHHFAHTLPHVSALKKESSQHWRRIAFKNLLRRDAAGRFVYSNS